MVSCGESSIWLYMIGVGAVPKRTKVRLAARGKAARCKKPLAFCAPRPPSAYSPAPLHIFKYLMIKTINLKKWIFIITAALFAMSAIISLRATTTIARPAPKITIAIDAGHGGIDGGTVGVTTGKDENYLNLQYSLCLEEILENYNINVVMTRTTLNGLYSPFAENKKLDDMQRRKEIVQKSGADILLSLHMNSFPLSSSRGAQVFFKNGDEKSAVLADCIQSVFMQTLPNARQSTSIGDYYMLNEFDIPCVIVECGYLSNPEEEALLLQEDYKTLVCGSIFVGLVKFLAI